MTIIADSGFVVAIVNQHDQWRSACLAAYRQQGVIYLPYPTLTEIAYLLRREGGNVLAADFLFKLPHMKFRLVHLEDEDLRRTADLLKQYADSRVDFVDASVVSIAERMNITRILTIDHRDFSIIRPRHCNHFELLPPKF